METSNLGNDVLHDGADDEEERKVSSCQLPPKGLGTDQTQSPPDAQSLVYYVF